MYEMGQAICMTVALFPGSSPAFCRILYSMRQKAGEEPGNESIQRYDLVGATRVH